MLQLALSQVWNSPLKHLSLGLSLYSVSVVPLKWDFTLWNQWTCLCSLLSLHHRCFNSHHRGLITSVSTPCREGPVHCFVHHRVVIWKPCIVFILQRLYFQRATYYIDYRGPPFQRARVHCLYTRPWKGCQFGCGQVHSPPDRSSQCLCGAG